VSGILNVLAAGKAASSTGGAEATAFLARTSGLNGTHTNAYIALIDGLVADSLWTAFDAIYIMATQDATTSLLSLVSATFNITAVNSPTFTADSGYAGNGSSSYLNTNFNASTATTPNFVRDSAHYSVWNLTNAKPDGGLIGNSNNSASWQFFSGDSYPRCNDAGSGYTLADPRGHLLSNRTDANTRKAYKNGSFENDAGVSASGAVVNANFAICSYATTGGYVTNQVAAASIGRALTGTEITNFYGRLRTYMTAVGVP
jgi:hypothetical protein